MKKIGKLFADYTLEEIEKYRKAFVIATLRRASYRWPWRNMAANRARVGWGLYKCEQCDGLLLTSEKRLDHIEPVVATRTGFEGFSTFIDRLFVSDTGFEVLCWECHDRKTEGERSVRTEQRRDKARQRKTTT